MTINSHLKKLSSSAVIRDRERDSIQRSITTLEDRLNQYFGDEIRDGFIFGSYTRGTILPRNMDERSDIDYIVLFEDSSSRPQTYLDRLQRFVRTYYSRSEISQSNPTIVLSLNHIKFELVPAIYSRWHGLRIPAKKIEADDWIETNPNDFNATLTSSNKSNNNLIKPMIRLVKYWNARNKYPFHSFDLERQLAERSYFWVGGLWGQGQLKDYFFEAIRSLRHQTGDPKYKAAAIDRAHQLTEQADALLSRGLDDQAEALIKRLLPVQKKTR